MSAFFRFARYQYCPRGAGDKQDHQIKGLVHLYYEGAPACVYAELVAKLDAAYREQFKEEPDDAGD